jgi:hypothetical protein
VDLRQRGLVTTTRFSKKPRIACNPETQRIRLTILALQVGPN